MTVLKIANQEFMLHSRNRWVVTFAVLFAGLGLAVAYFGMITSGYSGFQDFVRTSASLVNLGGFLLPLFALLLGVFSFLTNREYLELLATQPVSRREILLGRYLGLLLSVLVAAALGFGLPGAIIAVSIGTEGAGSSLASDAVTCAAHSAGAGATTEISPAAIEGAKTKATSAS
ncbi:MAG: ABC transporter permease subunit, partial [Thermoanaerobaculales bacterium]|nr:ABC transporter permease subunit [Thermoanaerobaculales bacterium]